MQPTLSDMTFKVSIVLLGPDLDPDMVSSVLQIEPSLTWRRGEVPNGSSDGFAHTDGGWVLDSSADSPQTGNYIPSQHIQSLLDRFRILPRIPLGLLKATSARLHFETTAHAPPDSTNSLEWEILPQQIRELARLGIGISGRRATAAS